MIYIIIGSCHIDCMQFCIRLALTTRQKLVCLKFANLQLVHIVSSKLDSSNEPQPMKSQEKVEGVGSKDLKFGWLVIADTLLIFPYCIVVLEWLIFFSGGLFSLSAVIEVTAQ